MADTLPNSLPRTIKTDWSMSKLGREWLYLYCASCGKDGGRVLRTDIPNVDEWAFYLCDDCAEKYGRFPDSVMVPDDVFWAKVAEAKANRESRESIEKLFRDRIDFKSSS